MSLSRSNTSPIGPYHGPMGEVLLRDKRPHTSRLALCIQAFFTSANNLPLYWNAFYPPLWPTMNVIRMPFVWPTLQM